MLVAVPDTKKELMDLIDAARGGKEVIIAPQDGAAVKLVPVDRPRFKHGILDGVLTAEGMPDFLEPMDEDDLRLWEGGK
jgi:antitoxin (DNA-binding transcriptional repressor) of toxin-antitoxin stability system